jgi:soluble epoxide hydrolase/lipid-phosphate phosphatase
MDAFMSILYPQESKTWLTDMAPRNKLKEWVLSDKVTPPPSYLTEDVSFFLKYPSHSQFNVFNPPQDFNRQKAELLKGGMAGPLCWYKQYATGVVVEDDKRASHPPYPHLRR